MCSSCCTSANLRLAAARPTARRSRADAPLLLHARPRVPGRVVDEDGGAARRLRVQVLGRRVLRRVAPELPVEAQVAPPAVPPTSGTYAERPKGCECAVTASGAERRRSRRAPPARRTSACGRGAGARAPSRPRPLEPAPREEREDGVRRQPVLGAAEDGRLREKERSRRRWRSTERGADPSPAGRAAVRRRSFHRLASPASRAPRGPRVDAHAAQRRAPAAPRADTPMSEEQERDGGHRRQHHHRQVALAATAGRSSSGREIRCCSTRDSGGTRTTTACAPSVSFHRYGHSATKTTGPRTAIETRLAGSETRPRAGRARIARRSHEERVRDEHRRQEPRVVLRLEREAEDDARGDDPAEACRSSSARQWT